MKTPLPPVLEEKLSDFRQRVWMVKLAEGLLAALFAFALSYLFVFVLDRFFETPPWLRLAIMLSAVAVLGLGLPLKWHRWVWRQRRLEDAARLLRQKFPRLGDQLLGIVELARLESGLGGRSETLVKAAMHQAAEAVKDRNFREAVPQARHRAWAWAASGFLALAGLAAILAPEAARNALGRWLTPWKQVERFTFARVEKVPSQIVVPYAEPFDFQVRLASDTQWSPSQGFAKLRGQSGVSAPLKERDYTFEFYPQKTDAPLDLSLGDVRKTVQVRPRARPELSSLSVRLKLPDYLKYGHEKVVDIRGGSISILRGTQAAFEAKATRELASAEMDSVPQKVEADRLLTSYQPVAKDGEHRFLWRDGLGLTPREPLLMKVAAVEDEAPKVSARREEQEQVVLDSEVIAFDLSVQDDFGIKRTGLSWRGLPQDPKEVAAKGEKIAAAGNPEKQELNVRATFCATREGVAPQTLEIRAWAEDYLPGRPHAESPPFVLHILNKTDHALWLTEQFGRWLHSARESYEREQQLHQTNKELRALPVAELDRPEVRRRVMQQAASENANSDRLAGLTQSGRRLVEQATRNPEFDGTRLESWATMLKSLQDIAAQRMPSVADLLKQSSGAPSKPMLANAAESKPTQPSSPSQQQQPSGQQKEQGGNSKSAPSVSHGEQPPAALGEAKPIDPKAPSKPPAPSITDREPGFGKPPEAPPGDPNAKPKPPGSGKLQLPKTLLGAAPDKKKPDENKPPESPAQQKMEQAVVEQKDLLAEFSKVSDQLAEILASLESSTFVKRFKAASKQQIGIAGDVRQKTLDAFGLSKKDSPAEPVKAEESIAKHEKDQSEVVRVIQSDLEAFYERKPDIHFRNILDQMKKTQVVKALAAVGDHTVDNLSGRSISGSEFWADTLDRWAEEMVAAGHCSACSSCSGDSLPPEIVLKVMQALHDEMKLRDETRELENSRAALEPEKHGAKSHALAQKQFDIGTHTQSAADDIRALPEGQQRFPKELALLGAVTNVMAEANQLLEAHNTGNPTIAAETEAIELLLQAKRMKPGGGGGGSSPGGGGKAASASSAALADLGPGGDASSQAVIRNVGQATGRAGREFPEEFRAGLDSYFNALEGQGATR
jgi:hypothetical protein